MTRQTRRQVPWDEINERRRDKAAKAPGVPQDTGACTGPNCSAAIRWAITVDGKRMPVDVAPDPAGTLVRVMVAAGDWRIRVLAPGEDPGPGVHRWTSHYATCPDAALFKARGARAGAAGRPAPTARRVLLAVDGPSLAHRAYYAYERTQMATPDGQPTWAVYGFFALLAGILDRVKPDAVVVGFDDRTHSERREVYPQYKAGRADRSPDLYAQQDTITHALRTLGVQVIVPDGLEADDVLGSAAAAAESVGWQCTIATSDKDAFALISEATTVLRLMSGLDNAVPMTPGKLAATVGVTPGQYLDYVALVGDTSDNLPGVLGIGPKTAVKLLAELGSLDAALADPDAVKASIGPAAAAKLRTDQAREALERNLGLMAIARHIPVDPDACRLSVAPATVAEVLTGLHLPTLVDRVTAALCPPPAPSAPAPVAAVPRPRSAPPSAPERTVDAPPLAAAATDPAPRCPDCDRPGAAVLPLARLDAGQLALTGEEVLVDAEHPAGDLLAVLVDDVWAVRPCAGEPYLPAQNRRRAHHCQTYPHTCSVPECAGPARLYPGGPYCDRHVPSTPRPARRGESCPMP